MTQGVARPASVLVVDGDASARRVIVRALRRAGLEILEAPTGQAALETIRAAAPGLLLLATGLPDMSGPEVVRTLRSRSETATLPILLLTAADDQDGIIACLDAGADDFAPRPVRLDELVARVRAHLRRQAAWWHVVEEELRHRASVVAALGLLAVSSVPEEAAEAVVRELAARTDSDSIAVLQLIADDQLHELATADRARGVRRGGRTLAPDRARHVLRRAREGPWAEEVPPPGSRGPTAGMPRVIGQFAAGAPIYAGDDIVGILTIGTTIEADTSALMRRAKLLAAAIDYANVLSARAGAAFADRRDVAAEQARLRRGLAAQAFHPVFQPIVELDTGAVVGFEALTRFHDGARPEVRFDEAARGGLGPDYELATIQAALDGGAGLPGDAFLSVNVSPTLVLNGDRRLRELINASPRRLVLELTEHVRIDDYRRVRNGLAKLGDVGLAVDDAGAGYASLRHILELRPAYVKLDLSLVRGIDGDGLRQALAAGLQYFATRIGCRLIGEGVETRAEADSLQLLGVQFAQGHLFGRPRLATAA